MFEGSRGLQWDTTLLDSQFGDKPIFQQRAQPTVAVLVGDGIVDTHGPRWICCPSMCRPPTQKGGDFREIGELPRMAGLSLSPLCNRKQNMSCTKSTAQVTGVNKQ